MCINNKNHFCPSGLLLKRLTPTLLNVTKQPETLEMLYIFMPGCSFFWVSCPVAVGGVNLFVPSVAIESGNVSLVCSWTSGTNTSVAWGKDSANLPSDPRFIINAGSLIINPVNRNDAGRYSCTVSNPISSQTATTSLTVYCESNKEFCIRILIIKTVYDSKTTCAVVPQDMLL